MEQRRSGDIISYGDTDHLVGNVIAMSILFLPGSKRPGLRTGTYVGNPHLAARIAFCERYRAEIGAHQDKAIELGQVEDLRDITKDSMDVAISDAMAQKELLIGGFAVISSGQRGDSGLLHHAMFARQSLMWHFTGKVRQRFMDGEHLGYNDTSFGSDHRAALYRFEEEQQSYWTKLALSAWLPSVDTVRSSLRLMPDMQDALLSIGTGRSKKATEPQPLRPRSKKRRKK